MKVELTKENFCFIVDAIEDSYKTLRELSDYTGLIFTESKFAESVDKIQDFLEDLLDIERNDLYGTDIDYYMWELDFGEKWEPGTITDSEGNDIPLRNSEDLWELIKEELDD